MASGGMEWAYRVIASQSLDPLAVAVVLHLGWRDAPNQRTDRGIARALNQHRSSIRAVTLRLVQAGIIARRSGQWVAMETIKIVEQAPDAQHPDPESADCESGPVSGPGQSVARASQWPGGGPLSGPSKGQSVAPMRKEKKEKAPRGAARLSPKAPALPCEGQAGASGSGKGEQVLSAVASKVEGGRRLFQGPDGGFYEKPSDPVELVQFCNWLAAALPDGSAFAEKRAVA